MVEKLSVQIALEGGAEIERQLADIGEAGQKAFDDISKSAEQAGGFKNLKPEEVTNKLRELGVEGTAAFDKIQKAVQSAVRWETAVTGVEALETAFVAVAAAAGIVAVAVGAAAIALSRYTSEAAKVSEQLAPLADAGGEVVKSVSALQIAFAEGGTSAEKFAQTFTNLQLKVAEAGRTMADDVEQSSQRIVAAHQSVEQAGLSVASAELNLQKAQLAASKQLSGERDPAAQKQLADAQARLSVEEAQQRVAAAELAQQQALHAARVAEANDLGKIIGLYEQLAQGATAAFDPLTTQATKNKALLDALAKAGEDWKFVLADILKNSSELERLEIGKALSLDPKILETLQQGSAALREQKQEVEALGIALSDVDRNRLKAFNDSWSKLGAIASAALQKVGAALAPIGTLIAQGLVLALEGAIRTVGIFVNVVSQIPQVFADVAQSLPMIWDAVTSAVQSAGQAISEFASAVGSVAWGTFVQPLVDVWGSVTSAVQSAGQTISNFISSLANIAWDAIAEAGVAAWDAITGAIQNAINAVLQFIGLKPSASAPAGAAPAPAGFAGGGLIGGRGSGRSDSNLAWVSRGEHIMPAAAVAQPGVLAFLEAIRRTGGSLPGFADGGIVSGDGQSLSVHDVIKLVGDTVKQMKQDIAKLAEVLNYVMDQGTSRVDKLLQALDEAFTQITGQARGGLLGGRGTGTSDSNLAWVSRGEHIMPARAVAQPGVLAFLEALRLSGGNLSRVLDGMGRFALGGLVRGPLPAFAGGGLVGGMSNVSIHFPGVPPVSGLRASSEVVDELRKASALAQVRSGGRKPSRYS